MTIKEPVFKILLRNVIIECNKRGDLILQLMVMLICGIIGLKNALVFQFMICG